MADKEMAMPKGKPLPSDTPYKGSRLDAKEAAKIAKRMAKPRSDAAKADHKKRMKKLALVSYYDPSISHKAPDCGPGKVNDIHFAEGKRGGVGANHELNPRQEFKGGEWRHGPDGPIYVSLEGWGNPDAWERKSGEIVGKIRNTPVGQKLANKRPDSPFKRAGGAAVQVVVSKPKRLVNKPA